MANCGKNCNVPLFRYFYNHLSNYTKTIIRLRLVNIGEYSPRLRLGEYSPIFTSLRRIIVKYNGLYVGVVVGCKFLFDGQVPGVRNTKPEAA